MKSASVTVDGLLISNISKGLLVFAAVGKDDSQKEAESMASKVLKVKLWEDDSGTKWKKNVQEIDGEVLCGVLLATNENHHKMYVIDSDPILSITIHPPSINKERQQARLPQIGSGS